MCICMCVCKFVYISIIQVGLLIFPVCKYCACGYIWLAQLCKILSWELKRTSLIGLDQFFYISLSSSCIFKFVKFWKWLIVEYYRCFLYTHIMSSMHLFLHFKVFFIIQKIGISDASSQKLLFAASHYLGGISVFFFFLFFF